MKSRRRKILGLLLWMLLDAVLVNGALVLAQVLRYANHISYSFFRVSFRAAPIMTVLYLLCFGLFGVYRTIWRYASTGDLLRLAAAAVVAAAVTYAVSLGLNSLVHPRNLFVLHRLVYPLLGIISAFLTVTARILYHFLITRARASKRTAGAEQRRVMVVGGGWTGANVVHDLQAGTYGACVPVVIVDDDATRIGSYLSGVPIERGTGRILSLASDYGVNEIIIAISTPDGNLTPLIDKCLATGCHVRMINSPEDVHSKAASLKVREICVTDLLNRQEETLIPAGGEAFYRGKRVLITGGGGSIGSELCRRLIPLEPEKVVLLDVNENDMFDLQSELNLAYGAGIRDKLCLCVGSVRDEDRVERVFSRFQPQIVLHAAAHKHVPLMEDCPVQAIRNNVYGTRCVAEAALRHGAECFLLISTDKAVNPTNIMGATKRLAEMVVENMNGLGKTVFCAVRFGNVLGSHGSVVPLFERQIRAGGPVTLTHPDIIRYFMTIPEAAGLVLRAASLARGGEIFVLDMGQPVKIRELAEKMIRLRTPLGEKPVPIVYTGLRPGEKLYEELLLDQEKIVPTAEKKIFVLKAEEGTFPTADEIFATLDEAVPKGDEAATAAIATLVKTYHKPGEEAAS